MEEGKKEKEHKIHVGQGNEMTGESKKVPTDMPQSNNSVLLVVIVASAAITAGVWFQTHKLGVEITNLVQILQNGEFSSKHQNTQQQSRPGKSVIMVKKNQIIVVLSFESIILSILKRKCQSSK